MMQKSPLRIHVSVRNQELKLRRGRKIIRRYPISTSRFGLGSEEGSNKTPLGQFRVSDKIGEAMPAGTIFVGRVSLKPDDPLPPTQDLVLSRILWLDGLEGHNANTRDRFIYIHGTKHEDKIGKPDSHGCIRMRNADVIELFDLVDVDTPVTIRE
jgi:L,D-transpeptidase YbiS